MESKYLDANYHLQGGHKQLLWLMHLKDLKTNKKKYFIFYKPGQDTILIKKFAKK